ncbi:MAG: SRPBCC domain-containing protein [Sandaracinus sp.]|nr:SRPBCC domain-containing protein [Myxococcales bacterium]MCB9616191.1 SRPBCC domain-containing protein [Sandaracinus sp.]
MNGLKLEVEGETVVVVTRHFAAPPEKVFRAHTDPAIVQRWMLGPDGWTMPVCILEAQPGGRIRYEWSDGQGNGFYLTGEFVELDPPHRILHVERMHLPDPTPDNRIETRFEADGAGTKMTMRMTLPDAQTRAAMLATGMEHGMEASYQRLEALEA